MSKLYSTSNFGMSIWYLKPLYYIEGRNRLIITTMAPAEDVNHRASLSSHHKLIETVFTLPIAREQ